MARRTLIAHELSFHEKYVRNGCSYRPANLLGENLLDVFSEWCETVAPDSLRDEKQNVWLNIEECIRYSDHIVLVKLAIGKWGEEGKLLDSGDGSEIRSINESHAATTITRAALFVPPDGHRAFYFSEDSNRGCGGGKLLPKFASYWSKKSKEITMERDRLIETEALKDARITEIEVRSFAQSSDLADPPIEEIGYISHTVHTKKRGRGLPIRLLHDFERNPLLANKYVGIRENDNQSQEVYLTVKSEKRTKKILLNDPASGFFYREVLNDWGEGALDDPEFIRRCALEADERLKEQGGEWNASWSNPR